MVRVELVYVPESKQAVCYALDVREGTTVGDLIKQTGVLVAHPEVVTYSVGIFAKPVTHETVLTAGDRVEIYRPLALDPMQKRRQRARLKK